MPFKGSPFGWLCAGIDKDADSLFEPTARAVFDEAGQLIEHDLALDCGLHVEASCTPLSPDSDSGPFDGYSEHKKWFRAQCKKAREREESKRQRLKAIRDARRAMQIIREAEREKRKRHKERAQQTLKPELRLRNQPRTAVGWTEDKLRDLLECFDRNLRSAALEAYIDQGIDGLGVDEFVWWGRTQNRVGIKLPREHGVVIKERSGDAMIVPLENWRRQFPGDPMPSGRKGEDTPR